MNKKETWFANKMMDLLLKEDDRIYVPNLVRGKFDRIREHHRIFFPGLAKKREAEPVE